MFFVLSKTAAFLLLPSNILIVCGMAGVVLLMTRWRRAGVWLASASLVVMALVSFLPVGGFLLWTLESRFPPWDASRGAPDGIIVLGGAINPRGSKAYDTTLVTSDAGRIVAMAKLAHAYPRARIVYAAGDASLLGNGTAEAQFVPPLLDSLGVARDRVVLETASRNTAENAAYTKALLQPKPGERWLLVTSAFHMPRAIGCFRKVGFPVEAYPAHWRTLPGWHWYLGGVFAEGLGSVDFAAHEWLGLIVYRLTGRIDTLLPGP